MRATTTHLALAATLLATSACSSTTILRSDGWRYSGQLVESDAETVTVQGRTGPIVIPRSEVVGYDLPGNGLIVVGGIVGVLGLVSLAGRSLEAAEHGSEEDVNNALIAGAVLAASGVALGVWGWFIWDGARETWRGPGTEVAVGINGVRVRF